MQEATMFEPQTIQPFTSEFESFGILEHAYIKTVQRRGRTHYAVHAADGTYLWHFSDRNTAFAAVRQQELEPVSVH
jgi:hypothetical protein